MRSELARGACALCRPSLPPPAALPPFAHKNYGKKVKNLDGTYDASWEEREHKKRPRTTRRRGRQRQRADRMMPDAKKWKKWRSKSRFGR